MMLWMKNPAAYRRRYYENEDQVETPPMVFGKKIASVLENRDYKEFPLLAKVPFYSVSEHELDVMIGDVPVKGFLDLYEPKTYTFGEVKTGSISHTNGPPWSKAKVIAHEQLPFYSLLIKTAYGIVDPWTKLIWLETRYIMTKESVGSRVMEAEGRDLELTGKMKVYRRRIAQWERDRIKRMILKVAKEISTDYTEWQAKQKKKIFNQ